MTTGTPAASALRQKVVGGLGWKLLSQIIAQGSRTIVGIVLAHLLTPQEFGLAAMALVFTSLAWIFTDLSLGSALIQRSVITEADRSTVFWTTLATGAVMTLVGVALAPVAGAFFSMPVGDAALCRRVFADVLVGAGQHPNGAPEPRDELPQSGDSRDRLDTVRHRCGNHDGPFRIRRLDDHRPERSSPLQRRRSSSGVSPPGGRNGSIRARACARFGSFGIKTLLSKILGYIIVNTDNLLIGRYLGSFALGVYTIAYNLMVLPAARIALPVQTVFYAAFARLQDDSDSARPGLAARHPARRGDQRARLPGAGHHRAGFRARSSSARVGTAPCRFSSGSALPGLLTASRRWTGASSRPLVVPDACCAS